MNCLKKSCAAVFVAAVLAILPLSARHQQGLVKVDLGDIRGDIAKSMNVNASLVPLSVEAPIDVAATACDMSVSDLKDQAKNGKAKCTAKKSTPALDTIVKKELKKEGPAAEPKQ
jgi:hypothetical protein